MRVKADGLLAVALALLLVIAAAAGAAAETAWGNAAPAVVKVTGN